MSMSAYHYAKNEYEDKFLKEYNVHSLWESGESKATYTFFTEKLKTRPYILTRANFIGSGMHASKWSGDNHSKWDDLRLSIVALYNSQLFGISMTGDDMCGFSGDTTEELCLRWMQLGMFYPFSRNHNTNNAKDQEPYVWDSVTKATRNAIRQKYSILRYYYTKLFEVSLNGGSLVRPLFFEYPEDENAYNTRNHVFMIGSSLLIVPVLYPKVLEVSPYCPNENWYDMFSGNKVMTYVPDSKIGKVIHVRAG